MSLYRTLLGDTFASLPLELQRFHGCAGARTFHGRVRIEGAHTRIGALLSRLLHLPPAAADASMHFELDAAPERERWTRCFPNRRMTSTMHLRHGRLAETLGPLTLGFELVAAENRLVMRVDELRMFGIPLPRSLARAIHAEEVGADGRLHFDVQASLPFIGRVVAYRGYLEVQ